MKIILAIVAFLLSTAPVQAQKIYSTKAGKISFFSSAPLEDIEAVNTDVESKLSTTGQVAFALLVKGFRFENELMEEHFNENYLESDKFPKSEFKGTIINIAEINLAKDGMYPIRTKGTLTIHGVSQPIETAGTLEVKGGQITAKTKFIIALKDYGISSSLIGKKIAQNIAVTVTSRYD